MRCALVEAAPRVLRALELPALLAVPVVMVATAAAGLDVFETEPPIAADHPLLHAKNAILAPHVGFFSEESLALRAEIVCDNIKAFLDGAPKSVIL